MTLEFWDTLNSDPRQTIVEDLGASFEEENEGITVEHRGWTLEELQDTLPREALAAQDDMTLELRVSQNSRVISSWAARASRGTPGPKHVQLAGAKLGAIGAVHVSGQESRGKPLRPKTI